MNKLTLYITGFVLSLALTLTAYSLVVQHSLPRTQALLVLALLALVQCGVQLVCFLHLTERSMRDRLYIFLGTAFVVCILVAGSLWIMLTLNGRMGMDKAQMQEYMQAQGGF